MLRPSTPCGTCAALINSGASMVLDLSRALNASSSAVARLLEIHEISRKIGRTPQTIAGPGLRRLLEQTGLDSLVELRESPYPLLGGFELDRPLVMEIDATRDSLLHRIWRKWVQR